LLASVHYKRDNQGRDDCGNDLHRPNEE
jgi:hypothetical protein